MTDLTNDTRFWDRAANRYAASPIRDMIGYERTIEKTAGYLGAADTVLEIGCGTGTTALRLAPGVARFQGTDVTGKMIAIAQEKLATAMPGNIHFSVARADAAVAPARSLDAVLAFNLLHLVKDRGAVLSAVRSMLKPGGLLISKTPCLSEMNPLIRFAVPLLRLVRLAPFVSTFSAEELEHEIVAGGFTIIERARHGAGRSDPRIFLVARKVG